MTCTQCCIVGSYTVSCLTYSTERGERRYPPVLPRTEENNAGTFETARKMNLLHRCETNTFSVTLFQTPRHLNFSLLIFSRPSLGRTWEVTLRLKQIVCRRTDVFLFPEECVQHVCMDSPSAAQLRRPSSSGITAILSCATKA